MKRITIGLLCGFFLISACTSSKTSAPVVIESTTTLSSILTFTATSIPTETPTASVTPLPTIPTFTPTFDVSTIVTVTPAPEAECPASSPYPEKDFDLFKIWENGNYQSPEETVLTLLNKYGPEVLVNYEKILEPTKKPWLFKISPMMEYSS